jgi:hypothetical protein
MLKYLKDGGEIMQQYIENLEKTINEKLKNIDIRVARRYNYYAIDSYHKGTNDCLDTIQTGMTRKELIQTLEAIKRVLWYEETKQ